MSTPRRRRAERTPQYESEAYRTLVARFGANLRREREARGWTQAEAAERCDMVMQQFQRTEAGTMNVTFTTLARICAGFAMDVRDLFAPAAPLAKRKRGRPSKTASLGEAVGITTGTIAPEDIAAREVVKQPSDEMSVRATNEPSTSPKRS